MIHPNPHVFLISAALMAGGCVVENDATARAAELEAEEVQGAAIPEMRAEPESCAFSDPFIGGYSAPFDAGNGIVVARYGLSSGQAGTQRGLNVVDCAARRFIDIRTFFLRYRFEEDSVAEELIVDRRSEEPQFVADLQRQRFANLDEIILHALQTGFFVADRDQLGGDQEDCGCAAFYPEHLGNQRPAHQRQLGEARPRREDESADDTPRETQN